MKTIVSIISLFLVLLLTSCSGTNYLLNYNFKIDPISDSLKQEMIKHKTFASNSPISIDRLKLIKIEHLGFDNKTHSGEIIVMDACSENIAKIFAELYVRRFNIEKVKLVNDYNGSDSLSMADNNSSSHNLRPVTNGKTFSLHSYGTAIDINPVQNPYYSINDTTGTIQVLPIEGTKYINRKIIRPGKENRKGFVDEVVDVFAKNGFYYWGGDWDTPIDYQHFQLSRAVTEILTKLSSTEAKRFFNQLVEYYNKYQKPMETEIENQFKEKGFNYKNISIFFDENPGLFNEVITKLKI